MQFIVSLLAASRIFAFLGGSFVGGPEVLIGPPEIVVTAAGVHTSWEIQNVYSPELRKLAETGTFVRLYLLVGLENGQGGQPVSRKTLESGLFYDLVQNQFFVIKSTLADTLRFATLDSAIVAASRLGPVMMLAGAHVDPSVGYVFTAQAVLGKTSIDALGGRSIDLMHYWNYRRPGIRTEPIPGSELSVVQRNAK